MKLLTIKTNSKEENELSQTECTGEKMEKFK